MTNIALIILSIWMVESTQGKFLVAERMSGHLMMKEIFVTDVNRFAGTHYTLEDRFDKHKSFEMARLYFQHYLPRKWTIEDAALLWRYGPVGRKNADRRCRYVRNVKAEYRRITK